MSSNKAQGSCARYKVPWSACSSMTGAEGLHSSCAYCQSSRHVMWLRWGDRTPLPCAGALDSSPHPANLCEIAARVQGLPLYNLQAWSDVLPAIHDKTRTP